MELNVIVFWCIEKLAKIVVTVLIVLRFFYVKIRYPTELAKHISLKRHFCVVRHSCSLNFVFFVGVELSSRLLCNVFLSAEWFVEKLLKWIDLRLFLLGSNFYSAS